MVIMVIMPNTSNNVAYHLAVTFYGARIPQMMDGTVATLKWRVKSIVIAFEEECYRLVRFFLKVMVNSFHILHRFCRHMISIY